MNLRNHKKCEMVKERLRIQEGLLGNRGAGQQEDNMESEDL